MTSRNGTAASFGEIFAEFQSAKQWENVSQNTAELYRFTAGAFCRWADAEGVKPSDLTARDVRRYLTSLTRKDGQPYADNSKRTHARDIRTLLNFAAADKLIPEPVNVVMPKINGQEVDYLSPEQRAELEALVARRVEENVGHNREAAIINLLLESGIRRAELCALDWSDIRWDEEAERGYVRVRNGKGGKSRVSYFTRQTWQYLAAYRDALWGREPDPEAPVFITVARRKLTRLNPRGLDWIMAGLSEELGVKIRAHKLRHTAAKFWGPRIGPYALMSMFGWGSRKMADHYCRLDERDVAAIVFGSAP